MVQTFLNLLVLLTVLGLVAWLATREDDKWRLP